MSDSGLIATVAPASPEAAIMNRLAQSSALTLDDLVEQVPQLTWNQIFRAVDGLARSGAIVVRRSRFEYQLSVIG